MSLPENCEEILIFHKLEHGDISDKYLREIVDIIEKYFMIDFEENCLYTDDNSKELYLYSNKTLYLSQPLLYFLRYHAIKFFELEKIYRTYNKEINLVATPPPTKSKIKKLDISLPNIILLDEYEFYDKENDIKYVTEKPYLDLYIIGTYIQNTKIVDIPSLIYFHKYTDITEDKTGTYYIDVIVVYGGAYGYRTLTYNKRYISNNIGKLINSYPDLKHVDEGLLVYIHQNYELVKRDVRLEIKPNETKKTFVIDNKKYEAYTFEEAKFYHDNNETTR